MIPPKTVRDILDAVRIEEVVEDFVALRKRGVNLIGLCPFHHEKTPSFNVNPTRNIFKCFGCGKGGDAVTFLMEHESFTYPDALRWLARKYNIEIEEVERSPEQIAEQQAADSLYIVNDFALRHFQEQLFETDEGKSVALSYFKQRGLREETIRTFGLGYAPDLRDLLVQRAKVAGHSLDLLKKTGLCSADGSRDFFRGRVMFAIHNLSGKVAAFAGRTMSADKNIPKYINSPETEIYVKNKTLYGAFQAKKATRQLDECILVEGYMDVISLHQAGIENVVASSGTSLTEGQLQLIKRNTANLKILYDGDPAGIKAALRGLDLALEQDLNVKIVLLPDREDPDSYVQKIGSEAFGTFITKEAKDFILFKTQLLLEETHGDPIKKSALIKDIMGSIARIPDPIKRGVYLKECATLLDAPEEVLYSETNKLITAAMRKKAEKEARQPGAASDSPPAQPSPDVPAPEADRSGPVRERPLQSGDEFQERDLLRILIQSGHEMIASKQMSVAEFILTDIEELVDNFDNPFYGRLIREALNVVHTGQILDRNYFLNHKEITIRDFAVSVLFEQDEVSIAGWQSRGVDPLRTQKLPDQNFDKDAEYAVNMFKIRKIQRLLDLNQERIKSAEIAADWETQVRLMKVTMKIDNTRRELTQKLNMVIPPNKK